MRKGGYKVINFKGTPLKTGTKVVIKGIYQAIEGTDKALQFTGLDMNNVEQKDTFVTATISGTNYLVDIYGYRFTITNADEVTITALQA